MTRQSQLRKDKFMTDNSKERKTIVPPTETLTALIADLTITAPQLNTESEKIDSYWRGLNAAYKFQNKNQITSALVIGFCVIKLDSIFDKELNAKTKGKYGKKLKEEFNLTPQRKSIFKDICTFFAEDFEKTGCFELKYEFRNYTISKLTELIPVMKQSPESINKFSPKMTVKEIRNKKAELGIEKKPSSTVNFSTMCGNYFSSSTLFEKTISADNVNSETIENCINEFIEKYSQYNGNLKLMFYKCKNIEEEKE